MWRDATIPVQYVYDYDGLGRKTQMYTYLDHTVSASAGRREAGR